MLFIISSIAYWRSYGVPVVATELLRSQLGWEHGRELLAADSSDPEDFAAHIVALYRSEALWTEVRNAAAARIRDASGQQAYERAIGYILA